MSLPAISLVAVPGRRRLTIEIARDIERRGFSGIYTPSMFGNMSQCEAMAWNTERIPFGTAIAPIYARTVLDFAQSAAFMHEVSGGRFRLGIGVAHAPGHQRMGVTVGQAARRHARLRREAARGGRRRRVPADHHRGAAPEDGGAGRRDRARAWCSPMPRARTWRRSLAALPAAKRDDPGVLHRQHAADLHQRRCRGGEGGVPQHADHYAFLPNYRNYWKEAGYVEEMTEIERAIAEGRRDDVPRYLTDRWLADVIAVRHRVRACAREWRRGRPPACARR